jgi:ubiquinone/menaquinone biosynthesis C-methylase UbiE
MLNLGCGTDIRPGWLNVDRVQLDGVDMIVDLERLPWALEDACFDYVLAKDVIEHCASTVAVVSEIQRILKVGGIAMIQTPHFTSRGAYLDPTHIRPFSVESFHFLVAGHPRSYYADRLFSRVISCRIRFDRDWKYFWNRPLEHLVNLNMRTQRFYEQTPLRMFPAMNIEVELMK